MDLYISWIKYDSDSKYHNYDLGCEFYKIMHIIETESMYLFNKDAAILFALKSASEQNLKYKYLKLTPVYDNIIHYLKFARDSGDLIAHLILEKKIYKEILDESLGISDNILLNFFDNELNRKSYERENNIDSSLLKYQSVIGGFDKIREEDESWECARISSAIIEQSHEFLKWQIGKKCEYEENKYSVKRIENDVYSINENIRYEKYVFCVEYKQKKTQSKMESVIFWKDIIAKNIITPEEHVELLTTKLDERFTICSMQNVIANYFGFSGVEYFSCDNSEWIENFSYNHNKNVLTMSPRRGTKYEYYNFPCDEWKKLKDSFSKGEYFNKNIRDNPNYK